MDFRTTPVAELARLVRNGEMSAREVVSIALERVEKLNPEINAFVAVDADQALDQAAAVDQVVAAGGDPGPLAGVPFGVKDGEDAKGFRTTYGSALHARDAPAQVDSVLVGRLRAAGAVVVGKTNLPELAWTAHTSNATFGTTRNPWHLDHSAGGSSGGSAAAVASGMVPLATGSDGGGSIRIPSSCCGLSGLKPSHGRVPAGGTEGAGWLGLSSKGVIGRRIADVVTALDVVVGPEPSDLRSLPRTETGWAGGLVDPCMPARVAWSPTLGYTDVDPEVLGACESVLDVLDSTGTEVVEIGSVFDQDPLEEWLVIVSVALLRSLSPYESRWDEVTPVLVSLAQSGRSVSATRLVAALECCHALNRRLVEVLRDADLLLTPTTAGLPPPNSLEGKGVVNGVVDPNWVRLTYPFNMTRSPAATLCVGLAGAGLPVGVQIVGPSHADLAVVRAAGALERAIAFDALAPL